MPELPEVETIKRSLEKYIVGYKITSLTTFRDSLRYQLSSDLAATAGNGRIIDIRRIAKYLLLDLDNHNSLIFHLGMTGRLVFKTADNCGYQRQKHDHIIIDLADSSEKEKAKLIFTDPRRFGMVYHCLTSDLYQEKYLRHMAIEPFSKQFDANYLKNCFKNKKLPIKSAIMDNRIVVGVGNIYASESLFLSGIHPLRPAGTLQIAELELLVKSIVTILCQAIDAGGTTLKDFVNGDNRPGYFKQYLRVYDRNQLDCYNCSAKIVKLMQSGRASYYCPQCQRL